MKKVISILLSVFVVFSFSGAGVLAFENPNTVSSTVLVLVDYGNEEYGWGSGFVISGDGLILTNAHVVLNHETLLPAEQIAICVIDDEKTEPLCLFTANVLASDEWLDLALLNPAYFLDSEGNEFGDAITPETFLDIGTPYVDFADELPSLGDEITILGFPGASGSTTVVLTQGIVSAFTPLYEDIIYSFTTDATINPGNSGGPVFNADEKVVGVAQAISINEIGGTYGYVIANETILLWFLSLVEEGLLNEDFVLDIFSNDSVDVIQNYDIDNFEDVEIFSDVQAGDANSAAILYLKNNGIVNGYPDGSYKPTNPLNRAELLKILIEGKGISPDPSTYANCFPDVGTDWYAKYVCYAKNQGWIQGYPDGTFKPASNVNKVEALKMLLETFGVPMTIPEMQPYNDVYVHEWYAKYVGTAKDLGLLEETGVNYWPGADITRGQISENIYRLLLYLNVQ